MSNPRLSEWIKEQPPRECPICGDLYQPTNPNQKYCSRECYKIAERRKPKQTTHYVSENMRKIAEIVKDSPDYGKKVARLEYGYKGE